MATPTESEIETVVDGYNRAIGAADYADTVKCQMQQITGDNYKMLWSTVYNGSFESNN